MLMAIMLLIVALALIGIGIYLVIKRKRFVLVTGLCISCEEKYLPHAQKTKYCAHYQYFWNGSYIVSTDHKSHSKIFSTGTEHNILVNPDHPAEMILAEDAKKPIWAIVIGLLCALISVWVFMQGPLDITQLFDSLRKG